MKLGILGTGKIVQEFLPWLVEHTPFTVQAVCSTPRSAAKAAELCAQYQIPQHTTNYFELLQWVDVVYIAVPNLQHARGGDRRRDRGTGSVGTAQAAVPL